MTSFSGNNSAVIATANVSISTLKILSKIVWASSDGNDINFFNFKKECSVFAVHTPRIRLEDATWKEAQITLQIHK